MKKERRNFVSLIVGTVMILTGLIGVVVTLPLSNLILTGLFSIILSLGIILALSGGLGKW